MRQSLYTRTTRSPFVQVMGAWNLCLQCRPLEIFVQFSSVAALWGSAGQGNYSSANAALDALASALCVRGMTSRSVQWGAWATAGMAVEKGALDAVQRVGIGAVSEQGGTKALSLAVSAGVTTMAVTPIRWPRKRLHAPLLFFPLTERLTGKIRQQATSLSMETALSCASDARAVVLSVLGDATGRAADELSPR